MGGFLLVLIYCLFLFLILWILDQYYIPLKINNTVKDLSTETLWAICGLLAVVHNNLFGHN